MRYKKNNLTWYFRRSYMSNKSDVTKRDKLIHDFEKEIGSKYVISNEKAQQYKFNTLAIDRDVVCVVTPDNSALIPQIIKIAQKNKYSIYTISTGHNWGYGCAMPVCSECVILDLHLLQNITIIDKEHGLFEIEPGVTQQLMYEFLTDNQLDFIIPTTGAGPSCSLIGNALERGYGLSPNIDHINAIMAFEAFLPDGSLYQGPLKAFPNANISHYYRYGVGPYLDALFSQSNYGIVTKATIALKPTPEHMEILYFAIKKESDLNQMVVLIQQLLKKYPGIVNAVNLMNKNRVESTLKTKSERNNKNKKTNIINMLYKNEGMDWIVIGSLVGTKGIINAAKKEITLLVRNHCDKVTFINPKKINRIRKITHVLSFLINDPKINEGVNQISSLYNHLLGIPNETELKLAYNHSNSTPHSDSPLNPSIDNIGLIWFPPLVPLVPEQVLKFVTIIYKVCTQFNRKPLITLTTLSNLCFNATIPIHFDKSNEIDAHNAKAFFNALYSECKIAGFYVYRLDTETVKDFYNINTVHAMLSQKIKQCIDPLSTFSPGRYIKPHQHENDDIE